MFKLLGEIILDFLSPKFCCGCQKMDTYLCPACYNTCDFISLPLQLENADEALESLHAVTYYDGVIKEMIHTCKYESVRGVCECLGDFLYYATDFQNIDLITAVPLHKKRLAERGFNQAEVVAEKYAERMQLPFERILERTVYTTPQASITERQERQQNITGCFSLLTEAEIEIRNKNILIIDDVTTTGATLAECAKVLRAAGAARVSGLVISHGN